jgi:eukaryotic-like serine/threonine-protein kinase
MTPQRWTYVEKIFHEALEQPPECRKEWVETACAGDAELRAEVLSLLGSDAVAGEGFIEKNLRPAVASLLESEVEPAPTRAGPYRLVGELGRGGMGTVYLAERDDGEYQAKVAVKLIRRGMDTGVILHRFYRERQTLARLQHRNIARLLDGGATTDGCPYIVMEFVEGQRITQYCRERNLNVTQKLALFLNVCEAIAYAHRQFVVHRDIKPGNILVDKTGEVKLLDFGICKLLQTQPADTDQTVELGLVALTPDYASPEQIRGDPITVASDIYSLAAVLYELLTGVKPHKIDDYTLRGLERAVCESGIPRPSLACPDSAIARQLKGDLDNILNVALDKDPRRRYESVDRFAEDIRRYLDHEPVTARPDSLSYRMGKFVRRRRGFVAAAAAVVIALSAGTIVSVRSARVANENLRLVRKLSNTFLFEVHDAVRDLPGATRARNLIVQTGLQYLENLSSSAEGDADFQYELASSYRRLGDVQGDVMSANLGNLGGALDSYAKALVLLDAALRTAPEHNSAIGEQILVHRRIGNIHDYQRELKQAAESFGRAVSIAEAYLVRVPGDVGATQLLAEVHVAASNSLRRNADWPAARSGYERAIELLEKLDREKPDDWRTRMSLGSAYGGRGLCDVRLGRSREALEGYRRSAAIKEQLLKTSPDSVHTQRDLMFSYSHIGDLLASPSFSTSADAGGALEAYGRMMQIARRIHDADPADRRARSDYAIALYRMASAQPASALTSRVEMLLKAVQLHSELARESPDNPSHRSELVIAYNLLGNAYQDSGDSRRALDAFRQGVQAGEPIFPTLAPQASRTAVALYRKAGALLARNGERRGAISMGEKALQFVDPAGPAAKKWPPESRTILSAGGALAMGHIFTTLAKSVHRSATDRDEARRWLRKGLDVLGTLKGKNSFTGDLQRDVRSAEAELESLQ